MASEEPVGSAVAWLVAYRSARFDDPAPTSWIDRVRPVITSRMAAKYDRARGGSVGAEWHEFVRARCVATVDDVGGVIPDEAPRTRSRVSVQVAGSLRTDCELEAAENAHPVEELAATLVLVKGQDGRWRVDRRMY